MSAGAAHADASAGSPRSAAALGLLAGFVAAVDLARWIRPDLLAGPELSWAVPRLLLGVFVVAAVAAAAVLCAGLFSAWSQTPGAAAPLVPLPLRASTLAAIAVFAVAFGVVVRFVALDRIPSAIWSDELVAVRPALALSGTPADFRDAVRMIQTDGHTQAMAGVVYLEGFRALLRRAGVSLFTIRLPEAVAGSLSLVTGMLLARELLPRGGASLAGLALAGLRWQIILGRFAWNSMLLVPLLDVAALLLVRARRRSSFALAAAGGLVAGVGAHLYLAVWIAAGALGLFLLWPQRPRVGVARRLGLASLFGAGFLAVASPVFLLRENRAAPYFGRGSEQGISLDYRRTKSWLTPLGVVADSFQAPWLLPDPVPRQDVPKSRLGWILGIPVAAALACAWRSPCEELSAFFFAHAAGGIAGSVRWGFPGHPNGYRYLYLTTVATIAVAAGTLWIVGLSAPRRRRAVAVAAAGLLAVAAFAGARDALFVWARSPATADAYWAGFTWIGRSALRWQRFGEVELGPGLFYSPLVVDAVRDFALDPDGNERLHRCGGPEAPSVNRRFRVAPPGYLSSPSERLVETVQDGWGRVYAVVYATRR